MTSSRGLVAAGAVAFVAAVVAVAVQAWVAGSEGAGADRALALGLLAALAVIAGAATVVVVARPWRAPGPAASSPPPLAPGPAPAGVPDRSIDEATAVLVAKVIEVRDLTNAALGARLGDGLAAVGYESVAPLGEPFDPAYHRAVDTAELTDGAAPGTIAAVERVGYRRHGTLIRPAEVVVYPEDR